MAAWPARKGAVRDNLSAVPVDNSDRPVQALVQREAAWVKTWVLEPGCLAEGWEARGWPETRPAWAERAPGWRAAEWEVIPVTADRRWPVEWGLIRVSAAGCRWAVEWGVDSGEPRWAEARRWAVVSAAGWEWEVAASVAAWGAGSAGDTAAEAADIASKARDTARGGQQRAQLQMCVVALTVAYVLERVLQRNVPQCLKWRRPVRIIAKPCSSQAVTVSSSRFEPPG